MDEEEELPRKSKKTKKEKKRVAKDDSDAEMDDEEEEELPLPDTRDHPLDKSQAVKIRQMAGDWAMTREKVHSASYGFLREVAASVAEFTEGDKGEKALKQIDALMRELLDTEQHLNAHEQALDEIHQKLHRGEEIAGVIDVYEKGVQEKMDTYKTKTPRQKYAKSDNYSKFKQTIYEVHHPDTAMPPLTDLIPREEGDDSDDEDDVQIGGVTQDYKCPLSLTHLVDPLTSKLCGHSYSAAAIREYLGRGGSKQCPATGCNKMLVLSDLEVDKGLAKRAKEAARRERAREDDDDDDDDVIE
ncbi:zinc-finger of the MIZ type in Nse subunit-domain-containing protein [Ganoderma leucocontextum]|nr:zinc-finger of the MIZ type in Nse subunit-domain-containing protein [Ganoderma leucocontextum]